MPEPTGHTQGSFCWHEIGTKDVAKAKAFYTGLFGWNTEDRPMGPNPEDVYTLLRDGDADIGGLYALQGPQFENVPSHWLTFVWVDDVDAAAARARELGGEVVSEPMEIPGTGRFAVLRDPTGAVFAVYKGGGHSGAARRGPVPGSVFWNELMTPDAAKAKAFYHDLIGWGLNSQDMGDFEYGMFEHDGENVGGVMEMSGDEWAGIPPHWMPYVTVANCDAAAKKAAELGGAVRVEPTDVPNVGRFAVIEDPTGAVFSVMQYAMPA